MFFLRKGSAETWITTWFGDHFAIPRGKKVCSAENVFDNFFPYGTFFLRKKFRTEEFFFPRKILLATP